MLSLNRSSSRSGFTLIELSMAILIIGLLLAGVALSSNMIKQAELRALMKEVERHQASYNNFISYYGAIPGDFSNAEAYWSLASCVDGGSAGDCNGAGTGIISYDGSGATYQESALAWKHLELAGMAAVSVDLVPSSLDMFVGRNSPISRRPAAGYTMAGNSGVDSLNIGQFSLRFDVEGLNALVLASDYEDGTNTRPVGAIFTPEEAFNLIRKMDDGRIDNAGLHLGGTTGAVRASDGGGSTADACINSSGSNEFAVGTNARECALIFRLD